MSLANDTPFFDTQMIRMPPFPGLSFIVSKLFIVYYCCDRTVWSVLDICSLGQSRSKEVDSVEALRELVNNYNAAIRDIRALTDNLASSHQGGQLTQPS
jgi:hypothetical protein